MSAIPTRVVARALAVTAAVNLVGGAAAIAMPAVNARLLYGPDVVLEGLLLRHHLIVWAFVVAMAGGYAVAARDPSRHTALVLSGAVGKLAAAAIWVEMVFRGLGTPLLLAGVAFDGSLGLLFLAWVLPRLARSTS